MLVPFSLPMIGLGIVTHKGSLLGLWFPSIYEAIALLLGVVTWAYAAILGHCEESEMTNDRQLKINLSKIELVISRLPFPKFLTPSFQLQRPQILALSLTLFLPSHSTFDSLEDPISSPSNYLYNLNYFVWFIPLSSRSKPLPFLAWVPTQGIFLGLNLTDL